MAARVQVIVEAKDATSGVFRAITSQLGAFGGLVEELTSKNVSWGNVATQAAQMVINGVKDAMKVTTEYAREVRDLSLASGQSAEESSRMLQVLDDYQLSAEDAKTATRALTKEGLAPTIDTIAKLSGEFQALTSVEERNAFVQKNLGRAGQEWLNLLSQGPDKIRAMNAAVSEGLILTEENIKASEEYRLALDQWNDKVMELKVSIGTQLLPVLNDMLTGLNNSGAIREEANRLMSEGIAHNREEALTLAAVNVETKAAAEATGEHAMAMQTAAQSATELEAAEKAAAEATKAMDAANKEFLSVLGNVSSALDTYNNALAEADAALAAGKITAEEHSAKVNQLSADYQTASKQIVLSIVEMKLAADGWTDAELAGYLAVGQQMGLFTKQQVQMANSAIFTAEQIANGIATTEGPMLHAGERAKDAAVDFGEMGDASLALGDDLRNGAANGANAVTTSINQIPKQTDINVDVWIRQHGSVPSYLVGGGDGSNIQLCFVGGTRITMSDLSVKPIEQVRIGDVVYSYNEQTGDYVPATVAQTFEHTAAEYLDIDGLRVTAEHPLYVIGKGWTRAGDVQAGDVLFLDYGGEKPVSRIIYLSRTVQVYNLTVEGTHTYFANGVLVHNKSTEDLEGRQMGGEVFAGVPVRANEAGQETFVPQQNGRILGHAEALHAASLGGGGGGRYTFYGPVTIQMTEQDGAGIMGMR
jgi:hypothetical protein